MSAQSKIRRTTPKKLTARKGKDPIVCLTAYTAPMAGLLDDHVDLLLVGDSVGMVLHGMESTVGVSLDMMIFHGQSVMRGSQKACVIVDMPFGTYEESPSQAFHNAVRIMKEVRPNGVKLEGGADMAPTIAFLVERGIPVFGHVGLCPQRVNVLGGFIAQGRRHAEWDAILNDAKAVAEAGAFAMVVEGVAEELAAEMTAQVPVPTIGIGASAKCDGQILVTEDMMGMGEYVPPFVKRYAELGPYVQDAVKRYAGEVKARTFPDADHTYDMRD